jgi:hypothetical protein
LHVGDRQRSNFAGQERSVTFSQLRDQGQEIDDGVWSLYYGLVLLVRFDERR